MSNNAKPSLLLVSAGLVVLIIGFFSLRMATGDRIHSAEPTWFLLAIPSLILAYFFLRNEKNNKDTKPTLADNKKERLYNSFLNFTDTSRKETEKTVDEQVGFNNFNVNWDRELRGITRIFVDSAEVQAADITRLLSIEDGILGSHTISKHQLSQLRDEIFCLNYNLIDRLLFSTIGPEMRGKILDIVFLRAMEDYIRKYNLDIDKFTSFVYERKDRWGAYKSLLDKDGFGMLYDFAKLVSGIVCGNEKHPVVLFLYSDFAKYARSISWLMLQNSLDSAS